MSLLKRGSVLLSLFSSSATLLCCALPALFVLLGVGAVFASLVSVVPQLIWFSQHKVGLFVGGGLMLLVSGFLEYRQRSLVCPPDPTLAEACQQTRSWSMWIWWISLVMYVSGGFVAFVLPRLL